MSQKTSLSAWIDPLGENVFCDSLNLKPLQHYWVCIRQYVLYHSTFRTK